MSGTNYDSTCPRCGGTMECYSDWKPWDMVSGICVDCGFTTQTNTSLSPLAEVNAERATLDMAPITELRKPTQEWLEGGYEDYCKGRRAIKLAIPGLWRFRYCWERLQACWANRRYINKQEFEEILRGN